MTMKITNSLLILAIGGLLLSASAFAQSSTASGTNQSAAGAGVYDPGHPRVNEVNQREQNEQNRIANGVHDGSLTPQEASRLEKNQANIQRHEQKMMARDGGHLTQQDQRRLNQAQNRQSHAIYHAKHN